MIEKLLNIIFPTVCGLCGKIDKRAICPKCYLRIKNEFKFYCINNNGYYLYFIGFYEGNLRELILKYKFREKSYLAEMFARIIGKNDVFIKAFREYDYIVPVPMHSKNIKLRGYNQSELLCKMISKIYGINIKNNCLFKKKENKRQSKLNLTERINNVKNVYCVENAEQIKNKKILLLDDIYTTGNTVNECIKELNKAKPSCIDVFVLAKTR